MQRVSTLLGISLAATVAVACVLLIRLSLTERETAAVTLPERPAIGVEHEAVLPLTVLVAQEGTRSRIEILHDAKETVRLSVPGGWTEEEARGKRISDIAEPVAFGVRSYQLPPGVAIVFSSPLLQGLDLFNPSGVPVRVRLKRTDVDAGFSEDDTILIQSSPSRIW